MTADHAKPGSPNRRRRVLAASTLAFGVLAVTVFRLSQPSPVERLQTYIGQDLRTLSEDEQIAFDGLLGRLAPEARVFIAPTRPQTWHLTAWRDYLNAKPGERFRKLRSWFLWRAADGRGRDRLVVFQGMPLWVMPGSSCARTFVFEANGKLLTDCTFKTGWRITIEDARWLEDCGHGFPCLLVCSRRSINGADVASQYYTLLDDTVALVRLEDSAGKFVRVVYPSREPSFGPPVPERTAEEWEAALCSSERAEVLRALLWLGGYHPPPATTVLETRTRPKVRSTVGALTQSEDLWVRDAAQHAWKAIQGGDR